MSPLLDRISIDPEVCFGKPCIRGSRIWISLILDLLSGRKATMYVRDDSADRLREVRRAAPVVVDPLVRMLENYLLEKARLTVAGLYKGQDALSAAPFNQVTLMLGDLWVDHSGDDELEAGVSRILQRSIRATRYCAFPSLRLGVFA